MQSCKPTTTPIASTSIVESLIDSPFPDATLYRCLVVALQYLAITRLDINSIVNVVCQHMHAPLWSHFQVMKRILRYIIGTMHHGLHYTTGPLILHAYTDVNWVGDPFGCRSTSGYCVFFSSNPILWSARKQPMVARSSTEAEYRSLASTAAKLTWLRMLLHELRIPLTTVPHIWCDNISAISLASNPVFHARTKHIEGDHHFVREKVVIKELQVHHISSLDQPVDIFTKSLSSHRFKLLRDKLMVRPTH